MTAPATPATLPRPAAPDPGVLTQFRWAVSDTLTITRRNLLVWVRIPAYLVFTVVQPVMFVLLFRYVFGGAINVPGNVNYTNFLMPGIIGQSAAFAERLATRARALIDGRLSPSVEDVTALAVPVLKHRMALTFAARADGETVPGVIRRLLDRIG